MFFVFCLAFLVSCIFEIFLWKKISPNIMVFFTMIIVTLTYELIGHALGFYPLVNEVYLLLSASLLIGCFFSCVCVFLFSSENGFDINEITRCTTYIPKFYIFIIWGALLYCIYKIFVFSHLYAINSDQFEMSMSSGLFGHVVAYIMASIPLLLILKKENKIGWVHFSILIIVIFSVLFLKQVKSWFMIPAVYLFISYFFIYKPKGRYVTILLMSAFFVLMLSFFGVYLFKAIVNGNVDLNSALKDIGLHFFFYFFSGIGAMSEMFQSSNLIKSDPWSLLTPFENIFNLFSGNALVSAVNPIGFLINGNYPRTSNVYTFFGTLYQNIGLMSLFVYGIIIFIISMFYRFSQVSIFMMMVFSFLFSFMAFVWFDFYYSQLFAIEGACFILLNHFIFKLMRDFSMRLSNE